MTCDSRDGAILSHHPLSTQNFTPYLEAPWFCSTSI